MHYRCLVLFLLGAAGMAGSVLPARAGNAATPLGQPALEPATLHSLGVTWIIGGDDNGNAKVSVAYRKRGAGAWQEGPALFRVEKGAHRAATGGGSVAVPDDARLFAGSVLLLQPDTGYEIRLTLADPDGGAATQTLAARTIAEPRAPQNAPSYHVVPGTGGGAGSQEDPYRGLAAAQERAKPGDLFLLHAGVYEGTFTVDRSGDPGRPIVWRAAGDGEAVLDAQGKDEKRPGRCVSITGVHDVWLDGLTLRNADYGLVGHDSARLVIRRCHIHRVEYGITFTRNDEDTVTGFFIADNLIEGPSAWPRTKGIEEARGIQATGSGHVICYNRVRGFADAIDTFPSRRCTAIDIHNNDVSELTDDGIEMDYSDRNTRCFHNRLTNVFQGISLQPVYGGPVYVFRNAMYNVCLETFKLHNSPSGGLLLHNTCVKKGLPLVLWTGEKVRNCLSRNNLFIGTDGNFAYETTAPMANCDFDYDGFGGGPWGNLLKWNNARYRSLDEVKKGAPVYRHAVVLGSESPFAGGALPPEDEKRQFEAQPDLRLRPGCAAIDVGAVLPGLSDGYGGSAPDLGAYELGEPLPHYGPRPAR